MTVVLWSIYRLLFKKEHSNIFHNMTCEKGMCQVETAMILFLSSPEA